MTFSTFFAHPTFAKVWMYCTGSLHNSQSTPQPASPYIPTYLLHCAYYVRPSHRTYSACSSKPKRAKPVWIAGDSGYTSSQPVLWLLARSVTKNGKQGRLSGFEVICLPTSNTYISTVSLLVNRKWQSDLLGGIMWFILLLICFVLFMITRWRLPKNAQLFHFQIYFLMNIINALSFYRSQNVLFWSKCLEPAQKFDCI